MEAKPKFLMIGDYWDDLMVDKVIKLLCELWDLFPTKFTKLNGII